MALSKLAQYENERFVIYENGLPGFDAGEGDLHLPLATISIIGEYGSGKSFLQNVILNYLLVKENCFIDDERILSTFPMEAGVDPETSGIDVYNKFIPYKPEGKEKIYVSVMDTEGCLDVNQNDENMHAIMGMAAYSSSVLIYNVVKNLNENKILNMLTLLQKIKISCKQNETRLFQDLVIVIRDWNDVRFCYGFEGGEEFKNHLIQNRKNPKIVEFFLELMCAFRSVRLFLMPIPNNEVHLKELNSTRKMSDVHEPFKSSLKILCEEIAEKILEPRNYSGIPWSTESFYGDMEKFSQIYREPKDDPNYSSIVDVYVEHKIKDIHQNALKKFQNEVCSNRFLKLFTTEKSRKNGSEKNKAEILAEAKVELDNFLLKTKAIKAYQTLSGILDQQFVTFNQAVTSGQDIGKKVLLTISCVVGIGGVIVACILCPEIVGPVSAAVAVRMVYEFIRTRRCREGVKMVANKPL